MDNVFFTAVASKVIAAIITAVIFKAWHWLMAQKNNR